MKASTEILHIYRRLLRAVTYLPDSFARTYMHNHVVDQFRRNIKRSSVEHITLGRVRKARSSANWLERAGNGSLEDLEKVLLVTYGRKGKRRRELIQALLRREEDIHPKDDLALKQFIDNPTGGNAVEHEPSPKLSAFIMSQRKNQSSSSENDRPKIPNLTVPKENIWGRAIPKKSQVSMRKKWLATTLDRLLPPVPRYEWDRLRDLSQGNVPLDRIPKRRSRKEEPREDREVEMREFRYLQIRIKNKAAKVDRVTFDPDLGLIAQTRDRNELDQLEGKPLVHSPRTLRRLYASIWSLTPTMSQDEVTKKWNVYWGTGRSKLVAGIIAKPHPSDIVLFEGIESHPSPQPPHTHRKDKRIDQIVGEHCTKPKRAQQ
jgi:hypothetical protein